MGDLGVALTVGITVVVTATTEEIFGRIGRSSGFSRNSGTSKNVRFGKAESCLWRVLDVHFRFTRIRTGNMYLCEGGAGP